MNSSASFSNQLAETVTLKEARSIIECLAPEQSVLLLSPPGIGKSDTVVQAATAAGLPYKSLLGTQIAPEDPSSLSVYFWTNYLRIVQTYKKLFTQFSSNVVWANIHSLSGLGWSPLETVPKIEPWYAH